MAMNRSISFHSTEVDSDASYDTDSSLSKDTDESYTVDEATIFVNLKKKVAELTLALADRELRLQEEKEYSSDVLENYEDQVHNPLTPRVFGFLLNQ